jgi:hypothetical protein
MAALGVSQKPRLTFPSDIQDDTQGHWMNIQAVGRGTDNTPQATVTLFIPGGINGSNMVWETNHEYVDKKLGFVAPGALGAFGAALQTGAGMAGGAINSKVEVLYRDTQLRRFQFSFIMAPQNEADTQALHDVVATLRGYSSPFLVSGASSPRQGYVGSAAGQFEYLSTGGLYASPSEWIIDFYYKNEFGNAVRNLNIPLIGRCVLQHIDINYTPTGEWSTFHDGAPTSAMLTMAFLEMRVIDQENILLDGY